MFQIEHRRAGSAVGRQIIQAAGLAAALASARVMAARLGADQMTVTDASGGFIGVFRADVVYA
jgi:hypothetical protein